MLLKPFRIVLQHQRSQHLCVSSVPFKIPWLRTGTSGVVRNAQPTLRGLGIRIRCAASQRPQVRFNSRSRHGGLTKIPGSPPGRRPGILHCGISSTVVPCQEFTSPANLECEGPGKLGRHRKNSPLRPTSDDGLTNAVDACQGNKQHEHAQACHVRHSRSCNRELTNNGGEHGNRK